MFTGPVSPSEVIPAPRDAVIFDCDGLLIDTQSAWNAGHITLAGQYDRALAEDELQSLIGLPLDVLGERLATLLECPGAGRAMGAALWEIVRADLRDGAQPQAGAMELVTTLVGTRPLGVASNAPSSVVRDHLRNCFDASVFDVIIGSDHVKACKPAPDPYLLACQVLGTAPTRTVALEDSPLGASSARTAGLYVVAVPSTPGMSFDCDLLVPSLNDPLLWSALGIANTSSGNRRT